MDQNERLPLDLDVGQPGHERHVAGSKGRPGAQGLEHPPARHGAGVVPEQGEMGELARQGLPDPGRVVRPAGAGGSQPVQRGGAGGLQGRLVPEFGVAVIRQAVEQNQDASFRHGNLRVQAYPGRGGLSMGR